MTTPDRDDRKGARGRKVGSADEPLLTVGDVAGEFQVSARTVRRWIADGDLPVVRIGRLVRIRPRDRDAFIREHLS